MTAGTAALPPLSVGGRGGYATERPSKAGPLGLQIGGTSAGLHIGGRGATGTEKPPRPNSLKRTASVDRAGTCKGVASRRPLSTTPSPLKRGASVDCSRPPMQDHPFKISGLQETGSRSAPGSGGSSSSGAVPGGARRRVVSVPCDAAPREGQGTREAVLRYVVQFGNNSPVVRQLMRNRPLWAPAPGDPGSSAGNSSYEDKRIKLKPTGIEPEISFLWSQYKCSAYLDAMANGVSGIAVVLNEELTIKLKEPKKKKVDSETNAIPSSMVRVHNHFDGNGWLCTKRGLCQQMVNLYFGQGRDPFGAVPLTFVVKEEGTSDPEYARFRKAFDALDAEAGQRTWIVKPGEWSNRGCGINMYNDADEVAQRVDSKQKVWVIQKYIERPLLVHKRKFDIRAYCLVVQESNGGPLKAFAFRDAYLRTTSAEYSLKDLDKMIHLNNDAVQKKGDDYGKFESANKMSLEEWQKYLDEHCAKDKVSVRQRIVPQMQSLMADAVRAVASKLNPRRINHCFEVFGFDFMVDASYRTWLIECNANPCLDLCSAYLSHLIPSMLEQALMLTIDRIFPAGAPKSEMDHGGEGGTKWDLIFDSSETESRISCSWVEALPEGFDQSSPCSELLGRSITHARSAKDKKKKAKDKKAPLRKDQSEPESATIIDTEVAANSD